MFIHKQCTGKLVIKNKSKRVTDKVTEIQVPAAITKVSTTFNTEDNTLYCLCFWI